MLLLDRQQSDTQRHPVTIEDVQDQEDYPRYTRACAPELGAGRASGFARTSFDLVHDEQVLMGAEVWGPFRDEAEWQLVKWLMKTVGRNQAEEYFKLTKVCRLGISITAFFACPTCLDLGAGSRSCNQQRRQDVQHGR